MALDIIINLREQNFKGNVLDVGLNNYGVVYNIYKHEKESYSIEYLSKEDKKISIDREGYDSCVLFLSFSQLFSKGKRKKLIEEVWGYLKDEGVLYIWDINKGYGKIFLNKIKVILPGDKVKEVLIKDYNILKDASMGTTHKIISNKFDIIEERDEEKIFYIKAQKKRRKSDDKIKGSFGGD